MKAIGVEVSNVLAYGTYPRDSTAVSDPQPAIEMRRILLLLPLFLALATPTSAQQPKAKIEPKVPEGVTYEKDIEYGKGGDTPLHMDIARPEKASKPLPCIVVIHGGGWRGGNFKAHIQQILDFAK